MGKSNSYDVEKSDDNEVPTFMATKFDVGKTPEAEGGGKIAAEELHPASSSAEKRPKWGKKVEFILACVGYAVGLGNVWRFPYLCHKSGGGAFLFPYFLMLILCGIPLMYMELAVGQYTRRGPVGALARICPLFKGAGLATVVISFLFTTYYNVIITWAMYYIGYSFLSPLPWGSCGHLWNSDRCWDGSEVNGTSWLNGTNVSLTSDDLNFTKSIHRPNTSISPTQDFYERVVLEKTSGIGEFGDLKWDLALILLLAWVIVYFCIFKGPQSTGKVVYFTATFPYIVLLILLVRGITLPGSLDGIIYFVKPRWELLLDAEVWVNAAAQNFNSIGIAFGGLIAMSSYNRFNNNIFKDVITVSVINSATSLLAGFVIFSILGHLAFKQQTDVKDVVSEGPGLVFIVYPEAFLSMPVAQLFAFLFFFMLICLGIDSQFASVEVVVTTIKDHFGVQIDKYVKRKEFVVAFVCIVSYICGLPNVFQGGIYFFQLIDYYAAALSLMYLAFFEVIAITWIYGGKRLARNVEEMTGSPPSKFFVICWYCVSPVLIFGIWIFSMIQYAPVELDNYEYPGWSIGLGWGIAVLSIICIPAGMVHAVYKAEGDTLWQRFKSSLRSPMREGCNTSSRPYDDQDFPLKEKSNLVDKNGGYVLT